MAVTSSGSAAKPPALLERLRRQRRRLVKRTGKRGIRALFDFLGRQSRVGDPPVFDAAQFPFLAELEANWRVIRAELDAILKNRDAVPPFQMVSPDQKKIARDDRWRTFILYGFRYRSERNCARCPETVRLLERIPNLHTAMFSILSPGYHIPPHRGVTKGLIRVHLALKVPNGPERCAIRIADEVCGWQEGKCLVFDDTFDHEVWNDTGEERVVLLFDFERPLRRPGRIVNRIFLSGIRWTAYVQEARRNQAAWEDKFEAAVRWADAQHIEADGPAGRPH